MTEKDKDQLQQAMTTAWEIRDGLRDSTPKDGLRLLDETAFKALEQKSDDLVLQLAVLSNNAINAIIKLEDEVGTLNDKLEVMAHEASSLEDEVAALQEQVTELNAKESES